MVQATTPTFIMTLPDTVDLSLAANIYFSLKQGKVEIQKENDALVVDGQTVSVYLTQAETLQLSAGSAHLQLNWTYADGSRACTNVATVQVTSNLLKEVVA